MSDDDPVLGAPVCYLVAHNLKNEDAGRWSCKSSHSDSNIYEVSANVMVYGKWGTFLL